LCICIYEQQFTGEGVRYGKMTRKEKRVGKMEENEGEGL
jgi:hypothetical protein